MNTEDKVKMWVAFLKNRCMSSWGHCIEMLEPSELPTVKRRVSELSAAAGTKIQNGTECSAGAEVVAFIWDGVVMSRCWWFGMGDDNKTVYRWPGSRFDVVDKDSAYNFWEFEGLEFQKSTHYDVYYSDRLDLYWISREGDDRVDLSGVDGYDGEEVQWHVCKTFTNRAWLAIPKGSNVIGTTGWVPSKGNETVIPWDEFERNILLQDPCISLINYWARQMDLYDEWGRFQKEYILTIDPLNLLGAPKDAPITVACTVGDDHLFILRPDGRVRHESERDSLTADEICTWVTNLPLDYRYISFFNLDALCREQGWELVNWQQQGGE